MRKILTALALAVVTTCAPASLSAQHTTCMAMGPDMLSCNTMGGNANQSNDDGGAALGKGLADLIAGINERKLRKRVGSLLADGDCIGAARLALEKGRLEMGLAIREMCSPPPVQQRSTEVAKKLQVLAGQARTPAPYGDGLTVIDVQAVGTQLMLTIQYDRNGPVPVDQREAAIADACGSDSLRPLLAAGAAVRAFYLSPDGAQVAKDEVTASVCGLS